uniref:Uncharacterized protein n=1 Tax=Glossina austeni TaxID=7395 RepID=A0A1A9VX26_GLOAU
MLLSKRRLVILSSRFSVVNSTREENNARELRKALQKKNPSGDCSQKVDDDVWTSTPRKSKIHFDQRRLLNQLIGFLPFPPPLATEPPKYMLKEPKKKSFDLISSNSQECNHLHLEEMSGCSSYRQFEELLTQTVSIALLKLFLIVYNLAIMAPLQPWILLPFDFRPGK